jgi:hypothetical protein
VPALDDLLAEVRARVGYLVVTCNTPGARVLVRKKLVEGPLGEPVAVRAGGAEVQVMADGYEPFVRAVELVGGETTRLDVKLESKANVAVLAVTTSPDGGIVLLDGTPLGPGPVEARATPGEHHLVVRKPGFVDAEVPLVLKGGERRALEVHLDPTPAVTSRWWFWAGAATLVAAGGAVTAALLIEKPSPTGSLNPGQLRAPLVIGFR